MNWSASTDNVGVTGYEVYLNGAATPAATTTGATTVNLRSDQRHHLLGDGEGQGCWATCRQPPVPAPEDAGYRGSVRPGAPTFTNITQTGATVNWSASTDNVGVTGYEVFLNGSATPAATTTGATTVALTGLTAGQSYAVTVKAKDAAGNVSQASAAGTLTTQPPADTTAPSVPGTPTFTNITQTGATVNWAASTDNVGVTGYEVSWMASPRRPPRVRPRST